MEPRRQGSRRTEQTRARLRQAIIDLAETRDLSTIDVTDLTSAAGINRTTYYHHYPDKQTLADEAVGLLLEELTEVGRRLGTVEDPASARLRQGWHGAFFRMIGQRPGLYRRLLASEAMTFGSALRRLNEESYLAIRQRLGYANLPGEPPPAVAARYAASGLHGLVSQWLESGMRESAEELADWIWHLWFPRLQAAGEPGAPPARAEKP